MNYTSRERLWTYFFQFTKSTQSRTSRMPDQFTMKDQLINIPTLIFFYALCSCTNFIFTFHGLQHNILIINSTQRLICTMGILLERMSYRVFKQGFSAVSFNGHYEALSSLTLMKNWNLHLDFACITLCNMSDSHVSYEEI